MAVVAQFHVSQVGEKAKSYYEISELDDVIYSITASETVHITLEPGDYNSEFSSLTIPDGVFITALPGAILPHNLYGNVDHVADLNGISSSNVIGHVQNKANPHDVTPQQVGNNIPLWNASKIRDVNVSNSNKQGGFVLAFNNDSGQLEYADPDTLVDGFSSVDFSYNFSQMTTDDLSEGPNNLYFTEARFNDLLDDHHLIDQLFSELDNKLNDTYEPTWNDVINKPTSFNPSPHNHPISQINGLEGELNQRAPVNHTHTKDEVVDFVETEYVHRTGTEEISGEKVFNDGITVHTKFDIVGTVSSFTVDDLFLASNRLILNSEVTSGVPSDNVLIEVRRGDENTAIIKWDEGNNTWMVGLSGIERKIVTASDPISTLVNDIGFITLTGIRNVVTTDDVREGDDNLYYKDSRVVTAAENSGIFLRSDGDTSTESYTFGGLTVNGTVSINGNINNIDLSTFHDNFNSHLTDFQNHDHEWNEIVSRPTNLSDFNNDLDFISDLSEFTTDDLSEGVSNLYWSDDRFNDAFNGKTASDIGAIPISGGDVQGSLGVNDLYGNGSGQFLISSTYDPGNASSIYMSTDSDSTGLAYQFNFNGVSYLEISSDGKFGAGISPEYFFDVYNGLETSLRVYSDLQSQLILETMNHKWFQTIVDNELGYISYHYDNGSAYLSPLEIHPDQIKVLGDFKGYGSTALGANDEIDDADLESGQVNIILDESNDRITFKVKYSNGTVKTGYTTLT